MSDTLPPIGALLFSAPPVLSDAEAAALAWQHFGKAGALKRLTSERDLNFRLTVAEGQAYVLKLANPAEPVAVTQFQNAALLHLEVRAPDLPVPRVMRSLTGATEVALPNGSQLRLQTYLEGTPLHIVPPGPGLRRSMGRMGAALARGLRGFAHPAADHVLLWDIKQAKGLRGLLDCIADPGLQRLARDCLDRFADEVAPVLAGLRWQVVHNDLNPHNVLVDPAAPDRVSGVLDFGDMVRTPLICDVAVAAAYQIDRADPLASLVAFAAAWHGVDPLRAAERAVLFDLVATRMVTTIVIASWRAGHYPENAAYILRNFALARDGLESFASLSRGQVRAALEAACE